MPNPSRPAHISFDISFAKTKPSTPIDEDTPLRLAILGHFGGGATLRSAVRVNCDNFDTVCAQLAASLHLPAGAVGALEVGLQFQSLDDFHPDHLLKNAPPLTTLIHLRARLLNPATASDAATELRSILTDAPAAPAAASPTPKPEESATETLARLLGNPSPTPATPSAPAAPGSIVDRLLKQAVSSTASSGPSPEQAQLLALLDTELGTRLRQLLHHPGFQAIESAWRGLDLLVREASDSVELHIIDISREELDRQFASEENPAATPLGRQITQIAPFAVLSPWTFGDRDTATLRQLSLLAAACGTAIIAGGAPELVGCSSFGAQPDPLDWSATATSPAFAELRRAPESAHLGLITPRFLLRQPYGADSDPIGTFPFEELPAGKPHEGYLWGSSAFLCGRLLINAFADEGWKMELGGVGGEIGGLPVHSFEADGETQMKPCAEAWLSDKAADLILIRGLMPVLSVRGSDSAILVSLRSISDPASPLRFRSG